MKLNKKAIHNQRELIEERVKTWATVSRERAPPSGWIKAIRESLGMTARQLGDRVGIDHTGILRLEERESNSKATLEMIERAAHAMNCKLVYAIVPNEPHHSLDEILNEQALKTARALTGKVSHSMRLEKQGVHHDLTNKDIEKLAHELIENLDPLLWGKKQ
jgi:predicted DNA-binding mobile mystery protein A